MAKPSSTHNANRRCSVRAKLRRARRKKQHTGTPDDSSESKCASEVVSTLAPVGKSKTDDRNKTVNITCVSETPLEHDPHPLSPLFLPCGSVSTKDVSPCLSELPPPNPPSSVQASNLGVISESSADVTNKSTDSLSETQLESLHAPIPCWGAPRASRDTSNAGIPVGTKSELASLQMPESNLAIATETVHDSNNRLAYGSDEREYIPVSENTSDLVLQSSKDIRNSDLPSGGISQIGPHQSTSCTEEEEDLPDLVIERTGQTEQLSEEDQLCGRRIVSIAHFIKSLRDLNMHACASSEDGKFVFKTERSVGLWSELIFACHECHQIRIISTDPVKEPSTAGSNKNLGVNDAAVLGFMSIGSGHANLEELLSVMGVPSMSRRTFYRREERLGKHLEAVLYEEMLQAGRQEKRLAEEEGQFCEDGETPYISVVVDGGWSHRSHGHRYTANSGVAVIIGQRTKKLLYMAVRNKICSSCEYYNRTQAPVPKHTCYKNWDQCSAAMEADIIAEGFQRSMDMHEVQYRIFIGDGDSSVHHQIVSKVDYGPMVEKRECANHVVKCYTSRLYGIAKANKGNAHFLSGPRITRIKNGARKAISHYALELHEFQGTTQERKALQCRLTKDLEHDLLNGPKHVLGYHEHCKSYFCVGTTGENFFEKLPQVLKVQMMTAANAISNKSRSLITNDTSNLAECVMSVVAKLSGGKQINRGQRGSYQHRCYAAGLSFQLGSNWQCATNEAITSQTPTGVLKQYAQKMLRAKEARNARRKLLQERYDHQMKPPVKKRRCAQTEEFYGHLCKKPDMALDELAEKCDGLVKRLQVDETSRNDIEVATRGQWTNNRWHMERRQRITASNFYSVCTRRDSTPCDVLVKTLLYNKGFSNAALDYGIMNEAVAIQLYEEQEERVVQSCGLFVDLEYGFLAASPDGLVGTDGILEVKCPQTKQHLEPREAATTYNDKKRKSGSPCLGRAHPFYYQIQGQLHITRRSFCDFVVYTNKGIDVQRIDRDDSFWSSKMDGHLTRFYRDCVLPEIVDPRVERSMPIRRPLWNTAAISHIKNKPRTRKSRPKQQAQKAPVPQQMSATQEISL